MTSVIIGEKLRENLEIKEVVIGGGEKRLAPASTRDPGNPDPADHAGTQEKHSLERMIDGYMAIYERINGDRPLV